MQCRDCIFCRTETPMRQSVCVNKNLAGGSLQFVINATAERDCTEFAQKPDPAQCSLPFGSLGIGSFAAAE